MQIKVLVLSFHNFETGQQNLGVQLLCFGYLGDVPIPYGNVLVDTPDSYIIMGKQTRAKTDGIAPNSPVDYR